MTIIHKTGIVRKKISFNEGSSKFFTSLSTFGKNKKQNARLPYYHNIIIINHTDCSIKIIHFLLKDLFYSRRNFFSEISDRKITFRKRDRKRYLIWISQPEFFQFTYQNFKTLHFLAMIHGCSISIN